MPIFVQRYRSTDTEKYCTGDTDTIRPSNLDIWSINNKDSDKQRGESDLAFWDWDFDSDLPVGDVTTTLAPV